MRRVRIGVIASGPITYGLLAVPAPVAHPQVTKPLFPLIVMPGLWLTVRA
jgi:hypothetical protein